MAADSGILLLPGAKDRSDRLQIRRPMALRISELAVEV
jgi:hypothetical protein